MNKKRIFIIGAGVAGRKLIRKLNALQKSPYEVIGFIDDDRKKNNKLVDDISILGAIKDLAKIIRKKKINEIFISIPSARGDAVRSIVSACEGEKVLFKI